MTRYMRPANMPDDAWKAFGDHVRNSRRRGIPFEFTPEEWWSWWQVDGRWDRRGRGSTALVMARNGDAGPYSPENVKCITQAENVKEVSPEVRAAAILKADETSRARGTRRRGGGEHLMVRGDGHPRSRAIITPHGRYGSGELAGEAYGITPAVARERARKQLIGWRFEDEPERPKPPPTGKPKIGRQFTKTEPLAAARPPAQDA